MRTHTSAPSAIVVWVAAMGVAIACGGSETEGIRPTHSPVEGPPALLQVGVDTLRETEQVFVARVQAAFRDNTGAFYITDQSARRLIVFSATGALVRTIGNAGDGPGEFRGPVAVAQWGSDTIAVTDIVNQSVSLFSGRGETFLWRTHVPGLLTSVGPGTSRLFVASYSLSSGDAVATIAKGEKAFNRWVKIPLSVTTHKLGMNAFPASFLTARGDTVAVGFMPSNEVLLAVDGGNPIDRFVLPNIRRRDIPTALDDVLRPVVASPERMTTIPSLDGLYWRPDGLILVWHKDWAAPAGGFRNRRGSVTEAQLRAYVSVVDRSKRRACVDIAIPTDWAENPALFGNGDLFFVAGHYVGGSGRPVLEVRRFQLPLDECQWTPLP